MSAESAKAASRKVFPAENEAMPVAGPVVLVVEDEPQMRRFLRPALESQGYRVLEASTAAEGLVQASSYNPDLVLLDLGLPDADGVDVTRRLREWSGVPILVISARGQERDKIAALDAGADDYLTKPFGTGELLARLRVAQRHATGFPHRRRSPCSKWASFASTWEGVMCFLARRRFT